MFFDKNDNEINTDELIPRKDYERLKKLADVHQAYLNNIYIFYKLKPTPFLESLRNLSYELMKFFDNVCRKHNLSYWMCYGTLLGALRHEDFVPWDDDLDVAMMRQDYLKMIEVIPEEIKSHGLDNVKCDFKIDKRDKKSKRWYQLSFYFDDIPGKIIGIDVFPFDYIDGDGEGIEDDYYDARAQFYKKRDESDEFSDAVDALYSSLRLTMDEDEYYIPGVEGVHGNVNMFSLNILKKEDLLPLENLKFGKYEFPAPHDTHLFLKQIYGKKYMKIPRKIRDHGRLTKYKEIEGIEDKLNSAALQIKKANDNFGD